ncbi:MAG: PLP-dependent transferase [Rubrivivax sp.]
MTDPARSQPGQSADGPSTALVHHAYRPPAGFAAPQVAVHKASTVLFADTAALRARDARHKQGYTYGLHGTPTTFTLEARIAALEGGTECCLVPSGLAAIALVNQALLKQGDEVLLPANVYGPSRELARHELAAWGISHRLYDAMDPASLAAAITPTTKLVWLEAPGSVTMEFPDLRALTALCRERGVLSALDNTWGAGLAFNGFELGADVVMQALTKYPSGGGDVLMGSVVTRDSALHSRILFTHMRLGLGVGANDAETLLRALPSMPLRYAAADAAGRTLAQWCAQQPAFSRVLHPALAGSPGHEHWAAQCRAAAGLFSVLVHPRYSAAQVDRFVEALRLFGIGFSWAGPMSLVVPYDLAAMRQPVPYEGTLVRFSIGLEDVADLQADVLQALQVMQAS